MTKQDDVVARELMDSLVTTAFTVVALLNQVAAEHDLSLTQMRLGGVLRDREPRISELADFLGLERSSASGLVDRAERRGLVRKTVSPEDGRAVHVSLTEEGQRLTGEYSEQMAGLIAPLSSRLSLAEQKRLSTLLNQVLGQ